MIRLISFLILLATLLNGSLHWLRSVGIVDAQHYNSIIANDYKLENRISGYYANPDEYSESFVVETKELVRKQFKQRTNFLYQTPRELLVLKLLKFFVMLIIVAWILQHALNRLEIRNSYHILALNIIVLLMAVKSLFSYDPKILLASINLCVILALVTFSSKDLQYLNLLESICKKLSFSLVILLLLLPIEFSRSIQYFTTDIFFNRRFTGFMIQPSTLGIFVLTTIALTLSLSKNRISEKKPLVFLAIATVLIIASGSNTAISVFGIFLLYQVFKNRSINNPTIPKLLVLISIIMVVCLILAENRSVLHSIIGRLHKYEYYFSLGFSAFDYLFGHGLGLASNVLFQLRNVTEVLAPSNIPAGFSTDSTPLLLMIQIGILGCLLFYGLLIKALILDPELRIVYLVLILSSLTTNIIEIFPLNVILGLMLAKSFTTSAVHNRAG